MARCLFRVKVWVRIRVKVTVMIRFDLSVKIKVEASYEDYGYVKGFCLGAD